MLKSVFRLRRLHVAAVFPILFLRVFVVLCRFCGSFWWNFARIWYLLNL